MTFPFYPETDARRCDRGKPPFFANDKMHPLLLVLLSRGGLAPMPPESQMDPKYCPDPVERGAEIVIALGLRAQQLGYLRLRDHQGGPIFTTVLASPWAVASRETPERLLCYSGNSSLL